MEELILEATPDPVEPETNNSAAPAKTAEQHTPTHPSSDRQRRIHRKKIFRGALRFYATLLTGILCVLILLLCLMNPLNTLLTQYEAAQPQYAAQEIFDALFASPDWALLYDMAGIQATQFEGRDAYVSYMNAKTGNQSLSYTEIPSGSTEAKCYSVRLGQEEVATFTMTPVDDGVSTFRRWTFGEVTVFFTRQESVSLILMPEYTVYINGVPLDGSYTTLQVYTAAEAYLPEGVHGYRYIMQRISGLLVQPEIVVLDEYNNAVPLTQDPVTGVYTTPIADTPTMTWGEEDLIICALQAQAQYAIRAITATDLREFFSPGSQAYTAVTALDPLSSKWKSYSFDESATIIKDFYRYSNELFSVYAEIKIDLKDKRGNITSHTIGGTYFFSLNGMGSYMVTDILDVDLQQRIQVIPEQSQ